METIIRDAALEIFPNTTYDDALSLLKKKLGNRKIPGKGHKMLCQSMLTYNDPMIPKVMGIQERVFKNYLYTYNELWPDATVPYTLQLSGKPFIFPSQRAAMIFCYHPSVVTKWYRLPGAPKNIRVPRHTFTFGTPPSPPFNREEWDAFVEQNRLPEGVLWGDLMMETDDDEEDVEDVV